MKEKTKQYMAGLFDAEGCFTINSAFRPKSNCLGFTAQIIVANTNVQLMNWIVEHFGGTYYTRPRTHGKTAYYWIISNRKHALSFISDIKPYLVIKKEQCNLVEEYFNLDGRECSELRCSLRDEIKRLKQDTGSVTTDMSDIPIVSNAYCAGYIDGDGCITNTGLQLQSKDRRSVIAFHTKFGGHTSKRELSKKSHKWCDSYVWSIYNKEKVEQILLCIIPYLLEKRQRAIDLVQSIRLRNGIKIQSELIGNYESELAGTLVS